MHKYAFIFALAIATPALAGQLPGPQEQDPVEQAAQGSNQVFHNVYNMQKQEMRQLQQQVIEGQQQAAKLSDYWKLYITPRSK